jgi:uncharacterized membrane protein
MIRVLLVFAVLNYMAYKIRCKAKNWAQFHYALPREFYQAKTFNASSRPLYQLLVRQIAA